MKYTIEGFSQKALVDLGLDGLDAILLRFLVDFYSTGRMAKINKDGKEYFWVKYQYILDEMPCLGISSRDSMARRLKKLVDAGVLTHCHHTEGGSFSYYAIGDKYELLVSDCNTPAAKMPEGSAELQEPLPQDCGTPCRKNAGANDSSTTYPSTKLSVVKASQVSSDATRIAEELLTLHRKLDPKFCLEESDATRSVKLWSKDIDLLIRKDKRTVDEIMQVLRWCKAPGCFWSSNIMSGKKLREKFSTLLLDMRKKTSNTFFGNYRQKPVEMHRGDPSKKTDEQRRKEAEEFEALKQDIAF